MTQLKLGELLIATVAGIFPGGHVQAQSPRHIDRTVEQLQIQVQRLHREVESHERNTPLYRHLHQDVDEMQRLVAHVHGLVHRGGSLQHLRDDVQQLDRSYHHIQQLVSDRRFTRQVQPGVLVHLRQAMAPVGGTIHHLEADLR